jgi:hypothetical protein
MNSQKWLDRGMNLNMSNQRLLDQDMICKMNRQKWLNQNTFPDMNSQELFDRGLVLTMNNQEWLDQGQIHTILWTPDLNQSGSPK